MTSTAEEITGATAADSTIDHMDDTTCDDVQAPDTKGVRRRLADVPLPRQVEFDGKKPWESFIKPFKAMALHCRWTEEKTCFRLLNCLNDIAAEYVYSVLPAETLDTLNLLEKALEDTEIHREEIPYNFLSNGQTTKIRAR